MHITFHMTVQLNDERCSIRKIFARELWRECITLTRQCNVDKHTFPARTQSIYIWSECIAYTRYALQVWWCVWAIKETEKTISYLTCSHVDTALVSSHRNMEELRIFVWIVVVGAISIEQELGCYDFTQH